MMRAIESRCCAAATRLAEPGGAHLDDVVPMRTGSRSSSTRSCGRGTRGTRSHRRRAHRPAALRPDRRDAGGALSKHADDVYAGLDARQQQVAERMFRCLHRPRWRTPRRPATDVVRRALCRNGGVRRRRPAPGAHVCGAQRGTAELFGAAVESENDRRDRARKPDAVVGSAAHLGGRRSGLRQNLSPPRRAMRPPAEHIGPIRSSPSAKRG